MHVRSSKKLQKHVDVLSNEQLKHAYDSNLKNGIKFKKKKKLFLSDYLKNEELKKTNFGKMFMEGLDKIKLTLNNKNILQYVTKIDEYYKSINLQNNRHNFIRKSHITNYKLYFTRRLL